MGLVRFIFLSLENRCVGNRNWKDRFCTMLTLQIKLVLVSLVNSVQDLSYQLSSYPKNKLKTLVLLQFPFFSIYCILPTITITYDLMVFFFLYFVYLFTISYFFNPSLLSYLFYVIKCCLIVSEKSINSKLLQTNDSLNLFTTTSFLNLSYYFLNKVTAGSL